MGLTPLLPGNSQSEVLQNIRNYNINISLSVCVSLFAFYSMLKCAFLCVAGSLCQYLCVSLFFTRACLCVCSARQRNLCLVTDFA